MHLAGEVDDRVDVQDGAGLGLLHDAGGDDGDKLLLADLTAVPGKLCWAPLGRPDRSAAGLPLRDAPAGRSSLTTSSSLAAAGWSASMVGRLAFDQFVPEVKLTDMFRFVVSSTTIWESWTHSSAPQP